MLGALLPGKRYLHDWWFRTSIFDFCELCYLKNNCLDSSCTSNNLAWKLIRILPQSSYLSNDSQLARPVNRLGDFHDAAAAGSPAAADVSGGSMEFVAVPQFAAEGAFVNSFDGHGVPFVVSSSGWAAAVVIAYSSSSIAPAICGLGVTALITFNVFNTG
jgi:hypothetical protein